jgi:hypothetical protein
MLPAPPSTQPIQFQFLASKEQYSHCHVRVADVAERLPAIWHSGRYYSLFKLVPTATQALKIVIKLGRHAHQLAMTQTVQGYTIWVCEPDAVLALPAGVTPKPELPTFSAAPCLILTKLMAYQPCYLSVPGLSKGVPGLQCQQQGQQRFYSLLRQESDAAKMLITAGELTRRGEAVLIAPTKASYVLCVAEPVVLQVAKPTGAKPVVQSSQPTAPARPVAKPARS